MRAIIPRPTGPWFFTDRCPPDIRSIRRVQSDVDYGIEVAARGRTFIFAWRSRRLLRKAGCRA